MAAAGRVITGFSKPYVAIYGGYIGSPAKLKYTSAQVLARGVDVSISANGSVDNIFYADNMAAESAAAAFVDGSFTLTVDGLLPAARNLIMGITAGTDWTDYNDDQTLPYCGLAFVMREVSDGVVSYIPVVLNKVMFKPTNEQASTQESSVTFQSESLSGVIFRADDPKHTWKQIGKSYASEAAAVTAITTLFA